MSTLNKIQNKRASDAFDILIFEKGLRIKNVMIDKDLDLMLVVLNNACNVFIQIILPNIINKR